MTKNNIVFGIIIIILIVIISLQQCHTAKQRALLQLQQRVLNDSMIVTTNKLGQQTASISLIQTDYATFKKLAFAKQDSLGKALQKLVNRRTISATIATQQMHVETVVPTDAVLYHATADTCNPTYTTHLNTEFRSGTITASRDSFNLNLKFNERLTFTQEWSKWRLFKKQIAVTKYTNTNPDVNITGLRTFTIQCDCSKKAWISFGIGNISGSLIGFGTGYLYGRAKK